MGIGGVEVLGHQRLGGRCALRGGQARAGLIIPADYTRRLTGGGSAAVAFILDGSDPTVAATALSAAQLIGQSLSTEIMAERLERRGASLRLELPVEVRTQVWYNPDLEQAYFMVPGVIGMILFALTSILTATAIVRERERGTIEHLLVMPVTPAEIMLAKIWSMGLVVLLASAVSLHVVVRWALGVPVAGSLPLFFFGAALLLFATTSMGIFMATVARNMPQFGMLVMLVLLPLQMLSGGQSPRESQPGWLQDLMLAAPTTQFVKFGQAILFRGAGIEVVWVQLLAMALIGAALFAFSLARFRKTIGQMA